MADAVHVAIPCNDRYWFYALVTAVSAVRGSRAPVSVHVIEDAVSDAHKDAMRRQISREGGRVDFRPVDMAVLRRFGDWHGSAITWSRLWLPEMFPELDWLVSADADVMFRGDVAALWALRSDDVLCLPSRDHPLPPRRYNEPVVSWYGRHGLRFPRPEEYFCAGLTLFNLRGMRRGDWAVRREAFLAQFGALEMPNADQCALNYILQDDKRLLPGAWGCFSGDENADIDWRRPGAVHFVEDLPWQRRKFTQLDSDLVVEWKKLANSIGGRYSWHGWRRLVYLLFKHNQWLLGLNRTLWLHFRSTRGVRT